MSVQRPTRWISDNEFDPRYQFWTRANVSEVLPDPVSPLGWDLAWEGAVVSGWRDLFVERCGMSEEEVSPTRCEAIGVFGGYGYLGASLFRIWAARTPGLTPSSIDDAYFGSHPDVPPYVAEPWHEDAATTAKMTEYMAWATGSMNQDELEADRTVSLNVQAGRPDLSALSDVGLVDYATGMRPLIRTMFNQHINQSVAASIGPTVLGQICTAIGRPTDASRLLVGFGTVDSALPSYGMWNLSRKVRASATLSTLFDTGPIGLFERLHASSDSEVASFLVEFDKFLKEFGSRGQNEWEIAAPSWEVRPDPALAGIDRMRFAADDASPQQENAVRESERLAVAEEIRSMISADPATLGAFEMAIKNAATFIPGRERSKTTVIRVVHEMRMAARELGRRAAERGALLAADDVFMLFADELSMLAGGATNLAELAGPRWAYREWLQTIEPPFIINGDATPVETWPLKGSSSVETLNVGDTLQGDVGCPGKVRAVARVILDPTDPTALGAGEILVAPMTDPSWTPLFVAAGGVVVDRGGLLSHAVIVSRELGIPCVVAALDATRRIPDGATIDLDGTTGTVTIVSLL